MLKLDQQGFDESIFAHLDIARVSWYTEHENLLGSKGATVTGLSFYMHLLYLDKVLRYFEFYSRMTLVKLIILFKSWLQSIDFVKQFVRGMRKYLLLFVVENFWFTNNTVYKGE